MPDTILLKELIKLRLLLISHHSGKHCPGQWAHGGPALQYGGQELQTDLTVDTSVTLSLVALALRVQFLGPGVCTTMQRLRRWRLRRLRLPTRQLRLRLAAWLRRQAASATVTQRKSFAFLAPDSEPCFGICVMMAVLKPDCLGRSGHTVTRVTRVTT